MQESDFKVGDVLQRTNRFGLATKVRVTEVTPEYFTAQVLEGENTRDPLRVYRVAWSLYAKAANTKLSNP